MTGPSLRIVARLHPVRKVALVLVAVAVAGPGWSPGAGASVVSRPRPAPAEPIWAGRTGHARALVEPTVVTRGSAGRTGVAGTGDLSRPTGRGRGAPGPRTYRPPVVAPVSDPFRPPPQPWLPGNRGIEYATVPGTLVRAIGPGRVSFAGPVAGALHVTVTHPDGLRSSYSFLAAVRVAEGQVVAAGEVLAVTGARLHLGVRRGDAYVDPASLWGRTLGGGRVVLVPLDGGGGGPSGPG